MCASQVQLQVFPPRSMFFSLSPRVCFVSSPSTRSVVFTGEAADDAAATLEKCWCDFYRRTGNIGRKTRLHFPQPEKKKTSPPPPSPSKLREVCLTKDCVWECVLSPPHTTRKHTT